MAYVREKPRATRPHRGKQISDQLTDCRVIDTKLTTLGTVYPSDFLHSAIDGGAVEFETASLWRYMADVIENRPLWKVDSGTSDTNMVQPFVIRERVDPQVLW